MPGASTSTAVIATLMMARFFHEGQVVEAYRGFELAIKKAALGVMDIRMPLKKVRKLFKLFDQDGNNSVDYMEV